MILDNNEAIPRLTVATKEGFECRERNPSNTRRLQNTGELFYACATDRVHTGTCFVPFAVKN